MWAVTIPVVMIDVIESRVQMSSLRCAVHGMASPKNLRTHAQALTLSLIRPHPFTALGIISKIHVHIHPAFNTPPSSSASSFDHSNMPREVEPSLNEKQFFVKALEEGLRIDGRAFDQFRKLELEFGDEFGVCDVRLGKTRYVTYTLILN